ncbi:MAG: cell division protein FtsL [Neptuniibacter caesariensis]|uniref:Cell division protein FtsL n=1 Tax=Neptuniibacter caesariensis TaxID=207954 RepID=A0A2G6JPR4_NEPCE|nr:MAG: cell division protein FtsL [Neptuniibacter caesariensis]
MNLKFWQRQSAEKATGKRNNAIQFRRPDELFGNFLTVFVLVVLILVSALTVVMSAFEYRQLFNQYQLLEAERDELQVEWGQLLLEQSAWAANNRVEQKSASQLGMKVPEIEQIKVVRNERKQ